MDIKPLKVTVCVLTYNRCQYLAKTLNSLFDAPGDYSLFVYDNGSTDETRRYLADYERTGLYTAVRFNHSDNHTAGYGMNRAIEMALDSKPDVILFSADDYKYHRDWFAKFIAFWQAAPPDMKLASLNLEPAYPWNEITGKVEYGGVRAIIRTTVGGSNWSFRVEDLDLIYPLREITGGEDLEVCRRLTGNGHKIAALDLTVHEGEKASVWGNQSWVYAQPLPDNALKWMGINGS